MTEKKEDNLDELVEGKKDPKEFMKQKEEMQKKGHHPKKHEEKETVKKEEKTVDKDKQIEELTDMLKRTQAEFINFKNRTEKETRHLCEFANADLIKRMLPVLDSFELALKTAPDSDFKKGVELVYAQLLDAFKQEGIRPIESVGKKLDTNFHEVMLKEKSDKKEDTVLEEFQKGYMLKDKVLRYAKVKVSAGN